MMSQIGDGAQAASALSKIQVKVCRIIYRGHLRSIYLYFLESYKVFPFGRVLYLLARQYFWGNDTAVAKIMGIGYRAFQVAGWKKATTEKVAC